MKYIYIFFVTDCISNESYGHDKSTFRKLIETFTAGALPPVGWNQTTEDE